jgi:hypothetical protein
VLLTSDHPVITQFVNGRRVGPIGMSEEKDEATLAREMQRANGADAQLPALVPQLTPTPGLPERQAVGRRLSRVLSMLATLPVPAQQAILASLPPEGIDHPASPGNDALDAPGQLPGEAFDAAPDEELAVPDEELAVPDEESEEPTEREGGWPAHWPGGRRS